MNTLFGIMAASIVVAAYVPYIFKIIKGSVKPHPFTWLVWMITSTSIFILQAANGSGAGAYSTGMMVFFATVVFILSARHGFPKVNPLDAICLVLAVLGVVVWLAIKEPTASIALLLGVEMIGFLPTYLKGWKKPYEESALLWGMTAMRQGMSLLAIETYTFITMFNQSVWFLAASSFVLILFIRRSSFKRPRNRVKNLQPFGS